MPAKLTGCAPILLVADVKTSAAYYRDKVGFSIDQLYEDPVNFAILSRNGIRIFLSQAKDKKDIIPHHKLVHNMWNIYFWVDDVQAIYDEFTASGADIDYHLEVKEYGVKEFGIGDPDGYDIAFAEILPPDKAA